MNVIVVDNVNNLSGAPMVAQTIAAGLGAPTFCIRQTCEPIYNVEAIGIRSEKRRNYFFGILGLLLTIKFWRHLIAARVVICNTCLTFPFAVLARLLGKRVICVIHESSPKNILYRVGIFASSVAAHRIVTPSRSAYQDIDLPNQKWMVIPNALTPDYSEPGSCVDSRSAEVRILFVGGRRAYKGATLFCAIQEYLRSSHPEFQLHAVGDAAFVELHGASLKLTPQIYRNYHFVLVLTDNAIWKETFGLVGCEAAACRCLPLFTDRFAYAELWSPFSRHLLLPLYDAEVIVRHVLALLQDRAYLEKLRDAARQHALLLTKANSVSTQWWDLVNCLDNQVR
jgi:glycosyltransferase involved in cell wall biosynthesis